MKAKPYFTRKNLIILSLAFFYALILIYTSMCIEAGNLFRLNRSIIASVGHMFGFTFLPADTTTYLMVLLVAKSPPVIIITNDPTPIDNITHAKKDNI